MKIIDVSQHNGVIDWTQVVADAVIIRIGYRGYSGSGNLVLDSQFWNNYNGAKAKGLKVGIYYLSQAVTLQEGVDEVSWIIHTLDWKPLDLPVFIDSEWSNNKHTGRADSLSPAERTAITVKWCETVKAHNYSAGVYASTSWFDSHLTFSQLQKYVIWCAQYASSCKLSHYDYWQYSSKDTMSGIKGYVDVSKPYQPAYPVLKRGSTGFWVQLIQPIMGVTADGVFGPKTEMAVKDYQVKHDLISDGIVGANTWKVISES